MYASFMVDPLGLEMIDRIGVDRVMWSSDYPHNESTFGYSERSLASVVEAVGAEDAVKVVSSNVKTSSASIADERPAHPGRAAWTSGATRSGADAPRPGARLRARMADKGIDALVLLANANVSYATGASWPLSDAGRANVERPVAVVLVDDEEPHLFTPFLADAARSSTWTTTTCTDPPTSTSPRAWRPSRVAGRSAPAGATSRSTR